MAYFEPSCGDLRVARTAGSGWTAQIVDDGDSASSSRVVGENPSIVLNPEERFLVSYFDASAGQLLFAEERETSVDKSVIDNGQAIDGAARSVRDRVGAFSALQLSSTFEPEVAYFNATTSDLRLATRDVAGWTTRTISADGIVGYRPNLAFDSVFGRVMTAERLRISERGIDSELFLTTESP